MAASARSTHVQELLRALAKDWEGLYRRYPDQAIFALNDDRVVEALEKRFREHSTLQDIKSLPYDFQTGLHCIYFEFAHASRPMNLPSSRNFLVVMDGNCDVVGVIEHLIRINRTLSCRPFLKSATNLSSSRAPPSQTLSPSAIKNFSQTERAPVNTFADLPKAVQASAQATSTYTRLATI